MFDACGRSPMAAERGAPEDAAYCSSCDHRPLGPRSLKRKLGEMGTEAAAWVAAEEEVEILRATVESHREMVEQLSAELEEERAAAASAAEETMGMILRLQREKGEVQMEARQYRLFAEEKMAHDREELLVLEDLFYEREQEIVELSREVQLYKDWLRSYGITLDALESSAGRESTNGDAAQLASSVRSPSQGSLVDEMEKGVVMGGPAQLSAGEPIGNGEEQELGYCRVVEDEESTSDWVYTVDAAHSDLESNREIEGACNDTEELICDPCEDREIEGVCNATEKELICDPCGEEVNIRKLDLRLQVLEADREMMKQAIFSMREDKAQLVLLKEIAQRLCMDVSDLAHSASSQEKKLARRPFSVWCFEILSVIKAIIRTSILGRLSFTSPIKWIISLIFWRRKLDQRNCRYTLGRSNSNVGLLLLLDNAPRIRQVICHSRIRTRSV